MLRLDTHARMILTTNAYEFYYRVINKKKKLFTRQHIIKSLVSKSFHCREEKYNNTIFPKKKRKKNKDSAILAMVIISGSSL